jgi:teichuronic acid biosynthesis glycosyltransferase TuaC
VVAVSQALKQALVAPGVDPGKVHVLRNGVDTRVFHPTNDAVERGQLGAHGTLLVSVGNLIELKGNDLVIRSLPALPGTSLWLIGDGPDRERLESIARHAGVAERVRFIGEVPQSELPRYYAAADALVLASSCEGWPNVLLEAMACGTPVVAALVGGTPEIVTSPAAAVLFEPRTREALVTAIRQLLLNPPNTEQTRRHAEEFSWDDTTRGQLALFEQVVGGRTSHGSRREQIGII